jgi:hypothetical protein
MAQGTIEASASLTESGTRTKQLAGAGMYSA